MEDPNQANQEQQPAALSNRCLKLKRGWYEKSLAAYEEGGEAIGRYLCYNPDKEAYLWGLIGGTGIWPKWFLTAFKYHWLRRNRDEYNRIKVARYDRRKSLQKRHRRLEEQREAALSAMPTLKTRASRRASTEN